MRTKRNRITSANILMRNIFLEAIAESVTSEIDDSMINAIKQNKEKAN